MSGPERPLLAEDGLIRDGAGSRKYRPQLLRPANNAPIIGSDILDKVENTTTTINVSEDTPEEGHSPGRMSLEAAQICEYSAGK